MAGREPEAILKTGLGQLSAVERRMFVLGNILERVKAGEPFDDVVGSFVQLGLLSQPPVAPTAAVGAVPVPQDNARRGLGDRLFRKQNRLRKIALSLVRICVNAVKAIPEFVKIKPKIQLSFPIPSIGFELEADGMTVGDLLRRLSEGLGDG